MFEEGTHCRRWRGVAVHNHNRRHVPDVLDEKIAPDHGEEDQARHGCHTCHGGKDLDQLGARPQIQNLFDKKGRNDGDARAVEPCFPSQPKGIERDDRESKRGDARCNQQKAGTETLIVARESETVTFVSTLICRLPHRSPRVSANGKTFWNSDLINGRFI